MTRREKRYRNRQNKRIKKRQEKLSQNLKFENVCSISSLYKSAFQSAKGVMWKVSVQKYMLNLFTNIAKTRKRALNGENVCDGFIEFNIYERGKSRHIRSVHIQERVIQKSFCANALIPVLTRSLITDNGASQKGKGTHFSSQRLSKHLKKFYKENGSCGFILLIDFKKYFDNINHNKMKSVLRNYFTDERILKLSDDFINAFGDKGLGLGSETSQINAVVYLNKIDHLIKEKFKIKYYGKYMDDSYFIAKNKSDLIRLLEILRKLYEEYGVIINDKKTCIIPLKQGFTFLKTRFYIETNGKIIKKPCRESITRERRKLKKQSRLLQNGELTKDEIKVSFVSWCGSMKYRNARKTVYKMTELYNEIVKEKKL